VTAQAIFGSAAGFNFGRDGALAPRLDLPDLEQFLRNALSREKRRLETGEDGQLSFRAPDTWSKDKRMRSRYDGFTLQRGGSDSVSMTLGVGHPVFDRFLKDAQEREAFVSVAEGLEGPLAVFSVENAIDRAGRKPRKAIVGLSRNSVGVERLLETEALIEVLRELKPVQDEANFCEFDLAACKLAIEAADLEATSEFSQPSYTLEGMLFPKR